MEATLKFNLNDPEDKMAHMRCVKSLDMACALFEIQMNLSSNLNQVLNTLPDDADKHMVKDLLMDSVYNILEEFQINCEELVN